MVRRIGKFFAFLVVMLGAGTAAAAGSFDKQALIEAAKKEGKLVFYASIGEEQVNQILRSFEKQYPFIRAEALRANSGRLKARLDAEIAAGQVKGDVLQMGALGPFLTYADSEQLEFFETPEMQEYPSEFKKQGVWTIFRNSPVVMAYNSRVTKEADAPKRWKDLLDQKYKGQLAVLDSAAGGQQLHWYTLREKFGPEYWQEFAKNEPIVLPGPNQVIDGLLTGEFKYAAHAYGYTIKEYQRNNAPVEAILPQDGVPLVVSPIGIIKGARNPNAARLFVDWILSQPGQAAMVEIMNDYSPRGDVAPPTGLPPWNELNKLVPADWAAFIKSTPEFRREWDQITAKKR